LYPAKSDSWLESQAIVISAEKAKGHKKNGTSRMAKVKRCLEYTLQQQQFSKKVIKRWL